MLPTYNFIRYLSKATLSFTTSVLDHNIFLNMQITFSIEVKTRIFTYTISSVKVPYNQQIGTCYVHFVQFMPKIDQYHVYWMSQSAANEYPVEITEYEHPYLLGTFIGRQLDVLVFAGTVIVKLN